MKKAQGAWYDRFSSHLLETNFQRGKFHKTLFIKTKGKYILIIQVYVDDILLGATNHSCARNFLISCASNLKLA